MKNIDKRFLMAEVLVLLREKEELDVRKIQERIQLPLKEIKSSLRSLRVFERVEFLSGGVWALTKKERIFWNKVYQQQ